MPLQQVVKWSCSNFRTDIIMRFYFSEKTSLDISCESSAWQSIHMKCQDLFSLKKKEKEKIECRLLQILLGALRVKVTQYLGKKKKDIFWCKIILNYHLSYHLISTFSLFQSFVDKHFRFLRKKQTNKRKQKI